MNETSIDLTRLINPSALAALISEAVKQTAPTIQPQPIADLVRIDELDGTTRERIVNAAALRQMAAIYNSSRAELPRNIYLYGGAGTGKSTLARDFAAALARPFYTLTLGFDTTKSDILGYKTISGEYITTPIIEAFTRGGVLLLDELDACGGQALLYINTLLSCRVGESIETPNGAAERSPKFFCIAAGNTIGTGATAKFCGRSALDDATRRRFCFLEVKSPRTLEESQTSPEFMQWLDGVRSRIARAGIEIEINLRDAIALFDLTRTLEGDRRRALEIVYPELTRDNLEYITDTE